MDNKVTQVVFEGGQQVSVKGRVAKAIEEILKAADAINNSSLKCKIIVNGAGKDISSTFELES